LRATLVRGLVDWLVRWHVGDLAGLAGLVVSIAGFTIAIWQIRRAKSVSEKVQVSVAGVRKELEQRNITVDLGELFRELEEIKHLHRLDIPEVSPRRYTSIRRKLIEVRGTSSVLSPKQRTVLQESISQFSALEKFLDSSESDQRANLKSAMKP
jgi:hypothetical protein